MADGEEKAGAGRVRLSEVRAGDEGTDKHGVQSQRRDLRGDDRKGFCQEGCGACCTFVVLNVNPAYLEKDVRHWLDLHGIKLQEREGQVWANIPLPCTALGPDKSCGLYGQAGRPQLCSDWPFNQQEIITLKEETGVDCTYYFTEGE